MRSNQAALSFRKHINKSMTAYKYMYTNIYIYYLQYFYSQQYTNMNDKPETLSLHTKLRKLWTSSSRCVDPTGVGHQQPTMF